jgi:plasmid stability protein
MGSELSLGLEASLLVRAEDIRAAEAEVRQVLRDLGLDGLVQIEKGG